MLQLNPPLPVVVDGRKGMAILVIDYGVEFDLFFVTAMDDTGELWCINNKLLRMQDNWTMGRTHSSATTP
jgi:hypothetical protein